VLHVTLGCTIHDMLVLVLPLPLMMMFVSIVL
jgi:hypothetical protein